MYIFYDFSHKSCRFKKTLFHYRRRRKAAAKSIHLMTRSEANLTVSRVRLCTFSSTFTLGNKEKSAGAGLGKKKPDMLPVGFRKVSAVQCKHAVSEHSTDLPF
jgi:hypothetical protein